MCGRYQRRSDKQRIAEAFELSNLDGLYLELAPDYNIAPTSLQPVVVGESTGRALRVMRWGFIPSWAKAPAAPTTSTINAKAESVTKRPMWKESFQRQRCLVIADGYYEWKRIDEKTREPYHFGLRSGGPFAFAGIWDRWRPPDGGMPVDTYSIITTAANQTAAAIHDRMPVILAPRDYDRWLAPAERSPVDLLKPYPPSEMTLWRVGKAVGNVRNNGPELLLSNVDVPGV